MTRYGCPNCKKTTNQQLIETAIVYTDIEFDQEGNDNSGDQEAKVDWDSCNFESYSCKSCGIEYIDPFKQYIDPLEDPNGED